MGWLVSLKGNRYVGAVEVRLGRTMVIEDERR